MEATAKSELEFLYFTDPMCSWCYGFGTALEDFATCADWELAGGWTIVDGERVKDDGLLEPFGVDLEEAQAMVMTARIMLGWVDPADLEADAAEEGDIEEEAEA